MLNIKTYVDKSSVHGLGLFANQNINKGQLIGEFKFGLDISLSEKEYKKLNDNTKSFFIKYGWKDKISGKYMLNVDNTRFINHHKIGNILHVGYKLVASKDIIKGDELLDNYFDIDEGFAVKGF